MKMLTITVSVTKVFVIFTALTCPMLTFAASKSIVLVHGLNMDGWVWQKVSHLLEAKNYHVTAVQMPQTSVHEDIAAVNRIIHAQSGPVVLVGHSYGGMAISQTGTHPSVKALVYIAAFQPEIGESLAELNAAFPAELPANSLQFFKDGYYIVKPNAWIENVADGLSLQESGYSSKFQTPANTTIFTFKPLAAAWQSKPHWSAIALNDRTVSPKLQQFMSKRSHANTITINSGHLLPLSHPKEVAQLIEMAAESIE